MRTITEYTIPTGKLSKPIVFGVVGDLHNEAYEDIWPMMEGIDALLVPGDISNRYTQEYENGLAFLREAAARYPTFFSLGNHDVKQQQYPLFFEEMQKTGAHILVQSYLPFGEVHIGGWYEPDLIEKEDMLPAFSKVEGV